MKKIFSFFIEAREELNKVSWPSWDSVSRSTWIVFVGVFIFTLFIYFVDLLVNYLMGLILS